MKFQAVLLKLYLTSTDNVDCNSVKDSVVITITPAPSVNAGVDQNVCITSLFTQLNGKVTKGATTGYWKTLGDGTFSNDSVLAPSYAYGDADTTAGSVQLVLTSTFNGTCNAEDDTITITFGSSSFVYAGEDQVACSDNLQATLDGFITGGSSTGQWDNFRQRKFFAQ